MGPLHKAVESFVGMDVLARIGHYTFENGRGRIMKNRDVALVPQVQPVMDKTVYPTLA